MTETLFAVGNGYLGLRGNVEEGRETHTHGTFINGFHEIWPIRHAEEAFGFARVGQTIVNVPDNKTIKLYVDDEPLLLAVADLDEYERTLDFRDGVLRRDIIWRTPAGKRVQVSSTRMVSFTQRHLAIMTFEVTMLDDRRAGGDLLADAQPAGRQDEYHVRAAAMGAGVDPRKAEAFESRVLEPQVHWPRTNRIILGYRCANSKMTLAVGVDHAIETDNDYNQLICADEDTGKMVYRVEAEPGRPIMITKIVSYHTSRGVPVRELVDRCRRTLDRVRSRDVDQQFADQRQWLDEFWERSDVEVDGQPAVQQAIRWNLFQLAQATARAEQSGVPAKGVTGSGYGGHYFWDTEIYVLPFLTYTSPRMARSALRFRYNMLDAARQRAPRTWPRAARCSRGGRSTARRRRRYYAAGTAQYHIDADISYALMQVRDAPPATTTSCGARASTSWSRPRGCGPTSASGGSAAVDGAARLPHPRRDRPGRVHDGGQRQPVHQRDGAVQPAPRPPRWCASSSRRTTALFDAAGRSAGSGAARGRRVGRRRPRRCAIPYDPAPGSTRRTRTSSTGRCGTWRTPRRTNGRCCCTTTRW